MPTRIPDSEIQRRQTYAKGLGKSVATLIELDAELSTLVSLIIWHGSLPLARGGSRYDVDFAIFIRSETPDDLIAVGELLSTKVQQTLTDLSWRQDIHYDGMRMFDAHTHWDPNDSTLPHVGVHFQTEAAKSELTGECTWRDPNLPRSFPFLYIYDLWRRFSFYYRHWIYEGVPVYDPRGFYRTVQSRGCAPAVWFKERLQLTVRCLLKGYETSPDGVCTVSDSRETALEFVASLAYVLEGTPIGRSVRYNDDLAQFESDEARELLSCVVERDLRKAAQLLLRASRSFS